MTNNPIEKQAAIDIGNTTIKLGIFQADALVEYYEHIKVNEIGEILDQEKINYAIVANVGKTIAHFIEEWKSVCPVIEVSSRLRLPFNNLYQTPETLGADRIALVAAAQKLYPERCCLCIDAGTCLTFDFITAESAYLGGSIAPGVRMRLRAMHEYTSSLPLITELEKKPIIGNTTIACMLSGALNGIIAEIKCISEKYIKDYPDTKILLTGGDAVLFNTELPGYITFNPHLVLIGLNTILLNNKT